MPKGRGTPPRTPLPGAGRADGPAAIWFSDETFGMQLFDANPNGIGGPSPVFFNVRRVAHWHDSEDAGRETGREG